MLQKTLLIVLSLISLSAQAYDVAQAIKESNLLECRVLVKKNKPDQKAKLEFLKIASQLVDLRRENFNKEKSALKMLFNPTKENSPKAAIYYHALYSSILNAPLSLLLFYSNPNVLPYLTCLNVVFYSYCYSKIAQSNLEYLEERYQNALKIEELLLDDIS